MQYVRENSPWSDGEEGVLIRYFRDGEDLSRLCSRHMRSAEQLRGKLIELGWVDPQKGADITWELLENEYLTELQHASDSGNFDETNDWETYHSEPLEDFNEWIANIRSDLRGEEGRLNGDEWCDSFDDLEPNDWEDFLGGPDDSYFDITPE